MLPQPELYCLEGHNGGDSAGKVIQSFGEVVVGGNYVVGFIVFFDFNDN